MSDRSVVGGGRLQGEVRMPGDKSVSHRALIFGALAEGVSEAAGLAPGADVRSTRGVLTALGVEFEDAPSGVVRVRGRGLGGLKAPAGTLDAGNSGTTTRLMAGVLSGHPFPATLCGDGSLNSRPMERVAAPLRAMGAKIDLTRAGTAPMTIRGGNLRGLMYEMPVASAQVKSAVLLAGLHAAETTVVIEKSPTRDHTERMLALFGAPPKRAPGRVEVKGGARLTSARVDVPGDPSSAAFWAVAAAASAGSALRVRGVLAGATRTGYLAVLQRMGADVRRAAAPSLSGEDCEDLIVRGGKLRGVEITAAEAPGLIDEVPILALAAAAAEGESVFRGLDELRHKESDRLAGIAALLEAFGAKARVDGDDLIVAGGGNLQGATVDSRDDHRLAMTGYVAGFLASGRTTVLKADCARISYPSFYDDFDQRRRT